MMILLYDARYVPLGLCLDPIQWFSIKYFMTPRVHTLLNFNVYDTRSRIAFSTSIDIYPYVKKTNRNKLTV